MSDYYVILITMSGVTSRKKPTSGSGYHNIHGTHVTANNSPNNNVVLDFVSDLKIVYYNNYQSMIRMPWTREEKIFCITTYL